MEEAPTEVSKGNILIVDDTPNNLRLLSSMLTEQGYEVRCATSGAVALMAIYTEHPDLVLMDVSMPGMDGYTLCKRLKGDAQTQNIPVIFLSALSETIDKVQAFQVGGIDYITKPFQIEEVLARIENQLVLRRMQLKLEKAEADARRALAQEKELNRLKSEFVSMLSHDFRTPLTSIQGFAELLHHRMAQLSPEAIDRYFDKINMAVEHLLHLLDEVLLIGGLEVGKVQCQPTSIDLKQFCHELVETLQFSVDQQPQICFTCTGTCTPAEMDPMLLQQILSNLLSNAIKYSPNGGQIRLDVNCQDDMATFRVQDQGIGIPIENQAHLFETFYRCSNVGPIKGTGLGLAVVKQCVDAHAGKIFLESIEGEGTTVTVTLPLVLQLS